MNTSSLTSLSALTVLQGLQAYQSSLTQTIPSETGNINVHHQFLPINIEAELEQKALFESSDVWETLTKIHKTIPHLETPHDVDGHVHEGVIFISVGSSSTQVYNSKKVIGAYYIGSDAIELDPSKAMDLSANIFDSLRDQSIDSRLWIYFNSISYFTADIIDLNRALSANQSEVSTSEPSAVDSTVSDRIITKERKISIAISVLSSQALKYSITSILLPPHSYRFSNRWLPLVVARELKERSQSAFVIDFGGGGMNINYYDAILDTMEFVGKDRFLIGRQDDFVASICDLSSDLRDFYIEHIRQIISQNIHNHSIKNSLSVTIGDVHIYQTGKLRQTYYEALALTTQ